MWETSTLSVGKMWYQLALRQVSRQQIAVLSLFGLAALNTCIGRLADLS
jgi:hypothetical protein